MKRLVGPAVMLLLLAIWLHALTGFGSTDLFERWVHAAVPLSAALICLRSARRHPRERWAWIALAAGLACLLTGDVIYSLAPDLSQVPVPSVSDPLWLAIFPAQYIAIVVLVRKRIGPTLWATRVDGLAGGLAMASLLASATFSTAVDDASGTPFWEAATNLAYPAGDLILLVAIISAVGLAGWRIDRLWGTLGAAVLAVEVADLIYMTGAEGRLGSIADALVSTGTLAFAAAPIWSRAPRPMSSSAPARGLLVPVVCGSLALGVLALAQPLDLNPVATSLACAALALVLARTAVALRENSSLLAASRVEAVTDALTGLNNRRRLQRDLEETLRGDTPHVLGMFDLNGFKNYNDSYGHGAGDLLLRRLGGRLADAVDGLGTAYRMGGDEFCVLAPAGARIDELLARCADALSARGDGFVVTAARGMVLVPSEARDASAALALADTRMYNDKTSGRPATAHQAAGVLLAVVAERAPRLCSHSSAVQRLARVVGEQLGITGGELDALCHAAALHDIGKMAIPDSILEKPGPLCDDEWTLIRRHTIIGERILAAAPALRRSATLVRSSHENVDGTGYPDGLSGTDIPLGARIVAVVDAFDAMVSERSYGIVRSQADALAELERCAGTQFDRAVVQAFRAVVTRETAATVV